MVYLLNDLLSVFWILTALTGIVYVVYITMEAYRLKMYYKTMTIVSILYTAVALWLVYLIITIMY